MLKKWDIFNEAVSKKAKTPSDDHILTTELVDDYFLVIKDNGVDYRVSRYYWSGYDWCEIGDISNEDIHRISIAVTMEGQVENLGSSTNTENFGKYKDYINNIYLISKRIENNYNVTVSYLFEDVTTIIFELSPTLSDAVEISFSEFKEYSGDIIRNLQGELFVTIGEPKFIKSSNTIEFTYKRKSRLKIDYENSDIKEIFDEAIDNIFGFIPKYSSIKMTDSKIIIKDYISNIIKFTY